MRRILVIRGGALGDFVLTLPALAALRAYWPAAVIELLGYPRVACLATHAKLVDHVHSLDSAVFAGLFADAAPGPQLAAFLASFDLIVSYLHDPTGCVVRTLQAAGRARVVCGSPMITDGHAADVLMRPITELGISWSPPALPALLSGSTGQSERTVVLHAGSGSPRKNWPLDRFLELARRIQGARCVFTLGEADAALEAGLAASEFECWRGLELPELAERLSGCAGFVGNDSGVTHLAAATGIPVVALFGPTDPAQWAPRGASVRVIHAPTMDEIAVEDVLKLW